MPTGNPGQKRPGMTGNEVQRVDYEGERFPGCDGCGLNIYGEVYRPLRVYTFHGEKCYAVWRAHSGYVNHSSPHWQSS